MEWRMAQPVLFCLPALICMALQVLLTAGLLLQSKPGFYRAFLFLTGSCFLLLYLLLLNHGYTLATTVISLNHGQNTLAIKNQYGSLQLAPEELQSVVVEERGGRPQTVWVVSEKQVLYLDRHFLEWEQFLPALSQLVELPDPYRYGETTVYQLQSKEGAPPASPFLDLAGRGNALQGKTLYYIPWLFLVPVLFYLLGSKAWAGRTQYFLLLLAFYLLPLLVLAVFFPPSLPLVVFIFFYPAILIFFSAMCLPAK